ncbi:hypothetical protein PZA11_004104 [Diplocarpon coronariae]|uniref:Uncharacterized protein n=1 Tax=Diplocarpon coronariae TaxID=2795749 RepID=A0A218YT42_9HELO|nr:hypothetical protein JHW43_009244 [Diplocarpon mali]OWO98358.1 hypothetical protein B2J93_8194 [Marssonina coronariae]
MATSAAGKALNARTLHLKVYPTPNSFAERREVLRVVERFGELSMFKSRKYDYKRPVHNAFIAVYNSPDSREDLCRVSPLRYCLVADSADGKAADESEGESSKVFELYATDTNLNHENFLHSPRQNPLHGPYGPLRPRSSAIQHSLRKIIPDSNMSDGLTDWDTEKLSMRCDDIISPEEQQNMRYDRDGTPVSERWLEARKQIVNRISETPRIMGGLQALYEERLEMEAETSRYVEDLKLLEEKTKAAREIGAERDK